MKQGAKQGRTLSKQGVGRFWQGENPYLSISLRPPLSIGAGAPIYQSGRPDILGRPLETII